MAKTPSLTVAEAEAAIGVPRGTARVSSANRGPFRKWLTARGLPSLSVAGLSIPELQAAYNDTSDATFERVRAKIMRAIEEDGGEPEAPQEAPQGPALVSVPGLDEKTAQALRVLQGLLGPQGVDEESVKRIVDARVADAIRDIPTGRLEIKVADRPVVTHEGARHEVFDRVLGVCAQGVNIMLVGPAGSGKTHLCEQVSHALRAEFGFSGAVASEYKLTGFKTANGDTVRTAFRERYEHGGVFLWDEIDASSASALLAFNAGLANGHQDFPDGAVKRHADFRAIASANTFGNGADRVYVGRNQMDGASQDRFFTIAMDYDERLERALYGDTEWTRFVQKVRASVRNLNLRHIVSMRAIDMGTRLLAAGLDRDFVEAGTLWKGLAPADVAKIRAGM